jgi:DNA-binding transcriptional MerR regulator
MVLFLISFLFCLPKKGLDSGLGSRVYTFAGEMNLMERVEFRIGEVAARAGVSAHALRYYERLRLLPRAQRSAGGFRLFGPEAIECVQFIKRAQELGLTLDEIKGLLATGGAEECRKVRDLLSKKIEDLDGKMTAMKDFRRMLARHLSACEDELETHGDSACCPVVAGGKGKPPQGKSGKK